jgi:rubrerythrin
MKCKTNSVFLLGAFAAFLAGAFFKVDLMTLLSSHHETFPDIALLFLVFAGISIGIDHTCHLLQKKEAEKILLYRKTVFGMNHLVRSLQSKFVMIADSDAVKKEFGDDLVELLKKSSDDIESILDKMAELNKADPEIVRDILETPNRCDICGCERLNSPQTCVLPHL